MPQPSDTYVSHSDLVELAIRDLTAVWANHEAAESLRSVIDRVFPALVTKYGNGAAGLAKAFFQQAILNVSEAPAGSVAEMPVAGPKVPDGFVAGAFADASDTLPKLERGLRRLIGQAATDVIDHNFEVFDLREKWARDPAGASCAYCAMLAGRGFVYNSEAAAYRSGHVQKGRVDHCSIVSSKDAAKAYRNGYDPNALYARFNDAANEVRADGLAITDAAVTQRMRDMFPDDFNDGHAVPSILGDVTAGWPADVAGVTPSRWQNHILGGHGPTGRKGSRFSADLTSYDIAKIVREVVQDGVAFPYNARNESRHKVIDGVEYLVGLKYRKDGLWSVLTAFPPEEIMRKLKP